MSVTKSILYTLPANYTQVCMFYYIYFRVQVLGGTVFKNDTSFWEQIFETRLL
jgi:hypothetical protein